MTYKEAADRIEDHMYVHYRSEYPHAVKITEALRLAINLLRKSALTEEGIITKGTPDWHVEFEYGDIENDTVFRVLYNEGNAENSCTVSARELKDGDSFIISYIDKTYQVGERYEGHDNLRVQKVWYSPRRWWQFWRKRDILGYTVEYTKE